MSLKYIMHKYADRGTYYSTVGSTLTTTLPVALFVIRRSYAPNTLSNSNTESTRDLNLPEGRVAVRMTFLQIVASTHHPRYI